MKVKFVEMKMSDVNFLLRFGIYVILRSAISGETKISILLLW